MIMLGHNLHSPSHRKCNTETLMLQPIPINHGAQMSGEMVIGAAKSQGSARQRGGLAGSGSDAPKTWGQTSLLKGEDRWINMSR